MGSSNSVDRYTGKEVYRYTGTQVDKWKSRISTCLPVSLFTLLLAFLLSGCVTLKDPEASQEYRADIVASVQEGVDLGQTLVSRRPGLNGFQLWMRLKPEFSASGRLTAELYHAPGDGQPLAVTSLAFSDFPDNHQVDLSFQAQNDSPGQAYYLVLKSTGGSVELFGRNENAYPHGQAFRDGRPLEADIGFRTTYAYGLPAMSGDLLQALSQLWLAIPLAVMLWLPGRLLLELAGIARRFDAGSRAALSLGLSMAAIPLLMTWTTVLRLQWSREWVWAIAGFLVILWIWQSRLGSRITGRSQPLPEKEPDTAQGSLLAVIFPAPGAPLNPSTPAGEAAHPASRVDSGQRGLSLLLMAITLFALAIRLAMARDLAAPAWVDSVHHAMISRLVVEQGSFPQSYAPFLDIDTASYHAGFHSLVAVFHWLSGLDIPAAMLLLGQVLNALAVVAVYLFTLTFVRDRTAAVIAALIAGVFTPMPAYYTSWGRYTQLAGLLILPAAIALTLYLFRLRKSACDFRKILPVILLAAVACAGLFLTHYRVVVFLAFLLLAYLGVQILPSIRRKEFGPKEFGEKIPREISMIILIIILIGIIAILLTLPWWPPTLRTLFIPTYTAISQVQEPIKPFSDFSWGFLTTAFGNVSLVLAGFGLALGILQRRSFTLVFSLWVGLLFLAANLGALRLPGAGFINNTSVEIMLFIPLAALGGYFLSWLISTFRALLPIRWRRVYHWSLGLAGVAVAIAGARALLPILNPITMLFREADRPAMAWIEENIPPGETILINPFAWGYGLYAGNDGGFWISPIAGRKTMPPPVLYGLGDPGPKAWPISEFARQALEKSSRPEDLHAHLQSQGIRYIYIGARGGALSPPLLRESDFFRELYARDGTYVYQLR